MTDDFASMWDSFLREFDDRNRRLRKEIEESWNAFDAALQNQADRFTPETWGDPAAGSLSSVQEAIRSKSAALLQEPLSSLRKARPLERTLSAVGKYPTDIEDVLRLLPQSHTASRMDMAHSLSRKARSIDRFRPGFRKKHRTFPIRDAARSAVEEHLHNRMQWDGKMVLLMARASILLLVPWCLYRDETLKSTRNNPDRIRDLSRERERWLERISGLRLQVERIMASYDLLESRLPERIAGALSRGKRSGAKRTAAISRRWQQSFSDWSTRRRAVTAELELENSSEKLLETVAGISSAYVESIDEEHARVLAELDKVRGWLAQWHPEGQTAPFPPPEAHLTAAEERVASWDAKVVSAARAALPTRVELMDIERALPGRRSATRLLEPVNCLTESLEEVGRSTALAGFREAEEGHREVIREIERAREVVAYSMEGDIDEEGSDAQVAEEGIRNAVSLLDYQKQSAGDFHSVVEKRLTDALTASFYRFHLAIDESKLGLYRYLVRQKGGRIFRAGMLSFYEKAKTGLRLAWDKGAVLWDRVLIKLGWTPPSIAEIEPVVRREFLGELLRLGTVPKELPALYRRLFRLVPIEDPRFLVGRDAEIGAMAQARRQWEEGRPVSILVAGARGSGKTSLLNCAHLAVFNDLPVMRGQFKARITEPEELHAFLASLLRIDVRELRPCLESEKRLVILEEAERIFLRKMGGFRAARALMDLISATSKHTLWILSLNQTALNFLGNIIAFEENFSHRINAMAVTSKELTEAILVRHNLSGLRLQLMSPESDSRRINALRNFLGLEKAPEQSYFDALYRQSEGIFRSAFELWLQSVDRIEGGVLYMLNPAQPEFGKMLSQLTPEDGFRLQAVLQHGSLTAEELALIFDEPVEKSIRGAEKLAGWDILEKDPDNPGFRVRPAAGRFVRNALYRQNLL